MKLADLLARERVVVPLRVQSVRKAAERLAEALIAAGAVSDPEKLRTILAESLPADLVAVGRAFLLHRRTDAVAHMVVALGVTPTPVQREAESAKQAQIVLLIVAPPREASQYLQVLGTFARALANDRVVEALLAARNADDVLAAAPLADIELPGYLTVRDVMAPQRLSVRPDAPLGEAARLMVAHDVHAVPVVGEADEVLGVVTHRELLRHLLPLYVKRLSGERPAARSGAPAGGDPHAIPVREVMDRSVLCVSEEQTLADVASMMVNRDIERFPVVREGRLVGLLTRRDIVRQLLGP